MAAGEEGFSDGVKVRHILIYGWTGAIMIACASTSRRLPPQAIDVVPPMAIAALIRGTLVEMDWLKQAPALCVALVPLGPPPSLVDRMWPRLESLIGLPADAMAELTTHELNIHSWSACQVDTIASHGERVLGGVSVRGTGARAPLVWVRDLAIANDSTMRADVGYWSGGSLGLFICETVGRKGVWIIGRCTLVGQS